MKFSISLVSAALLLAGCPDTKLPKVPPSAPEPKADISRQQLASAKPQREREGAEVYPDLTT